jgi:integrase
MPDDLDDTNAVLLKRDGTPRKGKGGRRTDQRTARDISNVNTLKALTRPTRVSENLWLYVRGQSKYWTMEWMQNGKRCWLGLGAWPEVSLTDAKAKVAEARAKLAKGEDPRTPIVEHRFRDVVRLWIAKQKPSWTSARYAKAVPVEIAKWTDDLLGDLDVNKIDTPDIEAVLMQETENDHPLWLDKHPTAFRLKGYIDEVLGYAMAKRWRKPGFNAAVWKDNLEHLLADPKAIHKPEKHPSLHFEEIAAFVRVLRSLDGMAYRCLDATILTGLRSNEAIGARWPEINLDTARWTVPGSRMKKRLDHTVALSRQAVALFQALPRQGDLVFGALGDEALRDALAAVMVAAGREWCDRQSGKVIVPHGFRASMATWAGEHGYEDTLIDVALAHAVGSDVLRRYQRGEKLKLREEMMARWADHLDGG